MLRIACCRGRRAFHEYMDSIDDSEGKYTTLDKPHLLCFPSIFSFDNISFSGDYYRVLDPSPERSSILSARVPEPIRVYQRKFPKGVKFCQKGF